MKIELINEDCLKAMKSIKSQSVDMILCDLPYKVTGCEWDTQMLDMEKLKEQYLRIVKPNGIIALFAIQPFSAVVMNTFGKYYSHTWYWQKNNATGGVFSKVQPMRCIEEIHIFRKLTTKNNKGQFSKTRNYMIEQRKLTNLKTKELDELLGSQMAKHYFTTGEQFSMPKEDDYIKLQTTGFFQMPYKDLKRMYNSEKKKEDFRYYPQGLQKVNRLIVNTKDRSGEIYKEKANESIQQFTNYPKQLIKFNTEKKREHPTQKPVNLLEYLIKTYTKEKEVIMDNCMGSGSTGVAAIKANRSFIGIEMDTNYYKIAQRRIAEISKWKRSKA